MMTNHNNKNPIGIFDSGIGGLTVANAIFKRLPHERILYFGDTAHLPYGDKSGDAIRYYCLRIVKFLLEKDCKMIVIACNSAASAAYEVVQDFFGNQAIFLDVINPLVETVAEHDYKKVGVIATKATIQTGIYAHKLNTLCPNLEVASLSTPLLAPMIEEGFIENNISQAVIHNYLSHGSLEGIEALLLACTHYPLIRKDIEAYFNHRITVFDSTDIVAKAVEDRLAAANLLNPSKSKPKHQFFVSDYTPSFEQTTSVFYGKQIELKHEPIWQ
jgi:glutamate racemase